jgi:DoxX-like family
VRLSLPPPARRVARLSLVAVWLWTALISAQQAQGLSLELVQLNGRIPPEWQGPAIWGGVAVDLLLGLWMAWRPQALAYWCALSMTLLMTLVGTFVAPELWLHPLGPMSKNLPILALLWLLAMDAASHVHGQACMPTART